MKNGDSATESVADAETEGYSSGTGRSGSGAGFHDVYGFSREHAPRNIANNSTLILLDISVQAGV